MPPPFFFFGKSILLGIFQYAENGNMSGKHEKQKKLILVITYVCNGQYKLPAPLKNSSILPKINKRLQDSDNLKN